MIIILEEWSFKRINKIKGKRGRNVEEETNLRDKDNDFIHSYTCNKITSDALL